MREHLLRFTARAVDRYPKTLLFIGFLLACLSLSMARGLHVRTSQLDLIPASNPATRHYLAFNRNVKTLDPLFVVARGLEPEGLKEFARTAAARLERDTEHVRAVSYRFKTERYEDRLLYFLPVERLEAVTLGLSKEAGTLRRLAEAPNLSHLLARLYRQMTEAREIDEDEVRRFFHFMKSLFFGMTTALDAPAAAAPPEWRRLFASTQDPNSSGDPSLPPDDGYFLSRGKEWVLLMVWPAVDTDEFEFVLPWIRGVREAMTGLSTQYPSLSMGLTGGQVIRAEERQAIKGDMLRTALVAIGGITLLFLLASGRFLISMLAVLALLTGIAWSLGLIVLKPGHLNLITASFLTMVLGLGIDFGIYLVSLFQEAMREGATAAAAVTHSIMTGGRGILTGAQTTSVAFFSLMLTDFPGFQELGWIAGMSLLLCLAAMGLILCPLLRLWGEKLIGRKATGAASSGSTSPCPEPLEGAQPPTVRSEPVEGRARTHATAPDLPERDFIERGLELGLRALSRARVPVLSFAALLAVLAATVAAKIPFDYNILNMQPRDTNAVRFEHVLRDEFGLSPLYNMLATEDLESAAKISRRLKALSSVGRVESLADYLPRDGRRKQELLQGLYANLEGIQFRPPPKFVLQDVVDVAEQIREELSSQRFPLWLTGYHDLVLEADACQKTVATFLETVKQRPPEVVAQRLADYGGRTFDAMREIVDRLRRLSAAPPLELSDLPELLRQRLVGEDGRLAVYVSPHVDVREEVYARLFIDQTREVAPEVTGVPVLLDEMIEIIRRGFRMAMFLGISAIVLMVWFDFHRVYLIALAILPLALGLLWTLGLMHLRGISYNPANFVALPILLGPGVAYGVYLLHRHRQNPRLPLVHLVLSTGRAILLSSLTSIIGFGSLALCKHRGLASLGGILFMGVGACLVASLAILPLVLDLVTRGGPPIQQSLNRMKDLIVSHRIE